MADLQINHDGTRSAPADIRVNQDGTAVSVSEARLNTGDDSVVVYSGGTEDSGPSGTTFIYVTETQLKERRQKVRDGIEPFVSARSDLRADADNALSKSKGQFRSLVDDGSPGEYCDDDPHTWCYTDEEADYRAAVQMSEWVRDLGLEYWFSQDDEYAVQAVDMLHHWCLDSETYMYPDADEQNVSDPIRQWITIPALFYGASFLRGHSRWGEYDGKMPWKGESAEDGEEAFTEWVQDWHDSMATIDPGWCQRNNKWAWRIAAKAAAGAYLDDGTITEEAFRLWRGAPGPHFEHCSSGTDDEYRPWTDYRPNDSSHNYGGAVNPEANGWAKAELRRDPAFSYHAYNMKALTMTALIADARGSPLWDYNAPTDPHGSPASTLRKLYNWMGEYCRDPDAWAWNASGVSVDSTSVEEAVSCFEHAHAVWGTDTSEFEKVLSNASSVSRPYYDIRLLGHVTLTHGVE